MPDGQTGFSGSHRWGSLNRFVFNVMDSFVLWCSFEIVLLFPALCCSPKMFTIESTVTGKKSVEREKVPYRYRIPTVYPPSPIYYTYRQRHAGREEHTVCYYPAFKGSPYTYTRILIRKLVVFLVLDVLIFFSPF